MSEYEAEGPPVAQEDAACEFNRLQSLADELAAALRKLQLEVGSSGWQNAEPTVSGRRARRGLLNDARAALAKYEAKS